MKLSILGFEEKIIFNDNSIQILDVENTKLFSNIIEYVNQEINGIDTEKIFLLDNDERILKFSNEVYLLLDLYNIDFNSKKILSKLYEIICNNISNNQDFEIEELSLKLRRYLVNEINELPFEFIMKTELEMEDIIKIFGVKIDITCYSSVLERLEAMVDLISILKMPQVLVIPNLSQFLDEKEVLEFYKYVLYNNIKLLVIEKNKKSYNQYEQGLRIDKNFNTQFI